MRGCDEGKIGNIFTKWYIFISKCSLFKEINSTIYVHKYIHKVWMSFTLPPPLPHQLLLISPSLYCHFPRPPWKIPLAAVTRWLLFYTHHLDKTTDHQHWGNRKILWASAVDPFYFNLDPFPIPRADPFREIMDPDPKKIPAFFLNGFIKEKHFE